MAADVAQLEAKVEVLTTQVNAMNTSLKKMDDNVKELYTALVGNKNFGQEESKSNKIEIIPQTKMRCMGFGCLMFLNKHNWCNIPNELQIFYGDDFIFDYNEYIIKKPNFIIKNLDFYTPYSVTSNDITITNGFMEREKKYYNSLSFTRSF
jgi:hypothetical protein